MTKEHKSIYVEPQAKNLAGNDAPPAEAMPKLADRQAQEDLHVAKAEVTSDRLSVGQARLAVAKAQCQLGVAEIKLAGSENRLALAENELELAESILERDSALAAYLRSIEAERSK